MSMIVAGLLMASMATAQQAEIDGYNVEWNTPSENSAGSMPLGNGELGANLWVEKNGDLLFYLSRTDAISEANRLMKMAEILRWGFTKNTWLRTLGQMLMIGD